MATATVTNSFTNGTTADADQVNTNFTDLLTFLNGSVLHLDGAKAMTGDLNFGGFHAKNDDGGIVFLFSQGGDLEAGTGAQRLYLPYNFKITEVEAAVGTAPTGAALIVDVNVDGTTIFTTQSNRPQIAISGFVASSTTIEDATHNDGQYLTVDIDQVGSTVAGSDLVVAVRGERV